MKNCPSPSRGDGGTTANKKKVFGYLSEVLNILEFLLALVPPSPEGDHDFLLVKTRPYDPYDIWRHRSWVKDILD